MNVLLDAARLVGALRFVTQSLIFGYGYGDHGANALTEDVPFGRPQGIYTDPLIASLQSAEQQTLEAEGMEGIALRYGIFYGPSTFSDLFVGLMRRRRFAIPRGGGGSLSWIHVEEAAAATVAALERGRPGRAYNVVDDEPVNWRGFTWALAEAYRTPRPLELPRWALRLVAPYLAFMMTSTLRVSNARAKHELGWTPPPCRTTATASGSRSRPHMRPPDGRVFVGGPGGVEGPAVRRAAFWREGPLLCRLRHAILNATRRTARDRGLRRGSV